MVHERVLETTEGRLLKPKVIELAGFLELVAAMLDLTRSPAASVEAGSERVPEYLPS